MAGLIVTGLGRDATPEYPDAMMRSDTCDPPPTPWRTPLAALTLAGAAVLRSNRVIAALVLGASLGALLVAAGLQPQPWGVGTSQQLGLAPCTLYAGTGIPCATCGMTTAISHAAHGNLAAAFYIQPAGALLAIALAAVAVVAGWALASGMDLAALATQLARVRVVVAIVAVILLAWIYTTVTSLGA